METAELIERARDGDSAALIALWQQMSGVIRSAARRYMRSRSTAGGATEADLIQAGFFAMSEAIKYFDPERGKSFGAYLSLRCLNHFRETAGISPGRTQPRDPLDLATSFDTTLDEAGECEAERIPDPSADVSSILERAERVQTIRAVLWKAVESLPVGQQDEMRRIAACDPPLSRIDRERGLRSLRANKAILELHQYLN